jgi:hypothetical protein
MTEAVFLHGPRDVRVETYRLRERRTVIATVAQRRVGLAGEFAAGTLARGFLARVSRSGA